MPELKVELPQTANNEWQDLQFKFDGQWMPDVDPFLIGPNNYTDLVNLRYKDAGLEGVNGYSKVNTTTLDNHVTLGDFPYIRNGAQLRTEKTQATYTLVHSLNGADLGRVFVNRTAIGSQGNFDTTSNFWPDNDNRIGGGAGTRYPYFQDVAASLEGRFSEAPQGNLAYCNGQESMIFGGDEQRIGALFTTVSENGGTPIDETERANNELSTTGNTWSLSCATGRDYMMILTTRPVQGFKFYVSTANAVASTLTIKTWTGAAWSADLVSSDGTSSGGATLAQTGSVVLSAHTESTAKAMHFEELYLYAYTVNIVDGTNTATATLYHATCDMAFQGIKDVWDGVYRQPIQAQVYDDSAATWSDYTLHVNEPSDINAPVGMILDQAEGAAGYNKDYIFMMFEEQMAGIKFTMLSGLVNLNTAPASTKVYYWNGSAWTDTSATDGTNNGTTTFAQTGLMSWTPPALTTERPKSQFGSYGYAYKIAWSATLSGTAGDPEEILVDIITGIPAQKKTLPFDFSAPYKTRLMLGGYSQGDEGNRLDYCAANSPDVWNGSDSANGGIQALYFGGTERLVAATQLYNRFSSSILSMLLVLKRNETYILIGDTPDTFTIYPVSYSIGCPAPLTLATAEVGQTQESGQRVTRNIAIWLSHSGPIMFDGAVLSPVLGIRKYFDPNDESYIEWDVITRARGWIDPIYKEYNLLIPTGNAATENNLWLVYDLLRQKWFTKQTGTAQFPQAGWQVVADDGERKTYAGIDTGYMMQLESGTSWDGTGILQRVKTGDFAPSQNIWDETVIRKFKIFVEKFTDTSVTNLLEIFYYSNTEINAGQGVIWQDSNVSSGIGVDFTNTTSVEWDSPVSATLDLNLDVGLQRVLRLVQDLNRKGWAHAFEFKVTTSDIEKGFRPLAWGIRYRVERKDDTAT